MITNYAQAVQYLGNKSDRPLDGRATRLIRRSPRVITVRYQSTDVVTYIQGEPTMLQSGGWLTSTTKARMTEYTRVRISASKGVWNIRMGTHDDWSLPTSLFYDGMHITDDGLPVDPRYPTKSDVEKRRLLDRRVSTYIKNFRLHIEANGIDNPDNGDCFGCRLTPLGDGHVMPPHGRPEPMGLDHYLGHIEENYFVPSLLWNAILTRGYSDPGFIWNVIQGRRDGEMAAQILRGYFRKLKPALLKLT